MRAELAVRARPSALARGPRAEAFSRSQVGPGPSWGRPKPSQSYMVPTPIQWFWKIRPSTSRYSIYSISYYLLVLYIVLLTFSYESLWISFVRRPFSISNFLESWLIIYCCGFQDPLMRVMLMMTGYKPFEETVERASSFGPIQNNVISSVVEV